ncbi:molybdenum cofactor guanylyltransferase [Romboutsia sp.]|uniref:molybdenum cofactor guanylyltransferase n=1 Tax=Romboutsia sp. TaxID=1965302 RepID=UPI003F323732
MSLCKSAVILAGGKSTRMEFDKQFLVINEKRLIYDLAKKLKQSFEEIIIVTNKPQYYVNCDYKIVSDEIKESGPLSGIYTGLKNSKSEYVYFVACDMPNIDNNYIEYLKSIVNNKKEIYITKIDQFVEPFHAIYKKSLFTEIEDFLLINKKKSIKSFLEDKNKHIYNIYKEDFECNNLKKNIFENLNNKQDLCKYIKESKNYGCN